LDEVDLANERAELLNSAALKSALNKKTERPSTGFCRDCGEAIEAGRLQVNPHAQDCADCAADAEIERLRIQRTGGRR